MFQPATSDPRFVGASVQRKSGTVDAPVVAQPGVGSTVTGLGVLGSPVEVVIGAACELVPARVVVAGIEVEAAFVEAVALVGTAYVVAGAGGGVVVAAHPH